MITIRRETLRDVAAVRRVNKLAFRQPDEADLVDRMRAAHDDLVSLVATDADQVVGHILFSPATITSSSGLTVAGMALGPMAVAPNRQRRGVGSALIQHGLAVLRELDSPYVIVLGHPDYYPRFGFVPASQHGLTCPWPGVADEVFMVLPLDVDRLHDVEGEVRYLPEFDEL